MRRISVAAGLLFCFSAHAQEAITTPERMDGPWVALHHSSDGGEHVDACILKASGLALQFQATQKAVSIQVADESASNGQSLPVTLKAGSFSRTFQMTSTASESLSARIKAEAMRTILDAFRKAPSVIVQIGSTDGEPIPLEGNTRTLDAFLSCMKTHAFDGLEKGGSKVRH